MTFQQNVTRLDPQVGPEHYKTYQIISPASTHTRVATCAEVECDQRAKGWLTRINVATDLGRRQARFIRERSGRRFLVTREPVAPDWVLELTFPPGQTCFAEHRVPLHREPLYRVRGGDYRGNPHNIPVVKRSAPEWVEDFGEHQQKIKDARERG